MEQHQIAYLGAIAASSGCVLAKPEIDDGIDVIAMHKHVSHTAMPDHVARLEIQLKATGKPLPKGARSISVDMERERWEDFNTVSPIIHKIVVIMSLPRDQWDWTRVTRKELAVRHTAFWVNIAGQPDNGAKRPTVAAPLSQVFDDIALCAIMERIGKGLTP